MNRNLLACAFSLLVAASFGAPAIGATILDDFNTNEGRFASDPDGSGTTVGLSEPATDGTGPSTADRTTTAGEIFEGAGAERLVLVSGSYFNLTTPATRTGFFVRFLSGGGTVANNAAIPTAGTKFGVYAATLASDIQISPAFDDGASLERAAYQTIVNDGQYRLYEFDLAATNFTRIAGTGGTANLLDASTVTLDSLIINSAVNQPGNVTLLLDSVQYDTVPEPTSAAAIAIAAVGLLARRRPR